MTGIVMTLLVRRLPGPDTECPYAVQITFPKEMSPGEMTSLTSARLIHRKGTRSTASDTNDSYHPEEWRAAGLSEQAEFAAQFNGNPRPWFCVTYSLCRSVYDYPGSGDKDTNNGQVWVGNEDLDKSWKARRKVHRMCEEELDAEWKMRLAREEKVTEVAPRQEDSAFLWTWRQTGSR